MTTRGKSTPTSRAQSTVRVSAKLPKRIAQNRDKALSEREKDQPAYLLLGYLRKNLLRENAMEVKT